MKKALLLSLMICFGFFAFGQNTWNNKKAAIVITYDDAIPQHLNNAIPVLDSLNLKATFYLTAYTAKNNISAWKKVASNGHELGNHTLYHPCIGDKPGREWVKKEYNLNNYTVARLLDEIKMSNAFLEALDGKKERTFAYPCADTVVNNISFVKDLKKDFVAARFVKHEMKPINKVDLFAIDCYAINKHTFADMKKWVDEAIETNSLLVILFHGVGGGNPMDVTLEDHRKILNYIKSKEQEAWIAPMLDVAKYIKQNNTKN
ncbi:MAG: polysaccharide deacetylase family protein [Pedobacter sp.]|uniref:polysaccharide deacetylase family protein n=1 Tax=Pedobacter sp. TaxID=1411316 RepID=UPI002806DB2C|nr:polysaccharide deacetylase family protein [Pedobacter sp.]MDQ8004085.1 polysaccharide deacetylase family protein [Pedobacter sp.]